MTTATTLSPGKSCISGNSDRSLFSARRHSSTITDYSAPAYFLIGAALHLAESGDGRAFADIRSKVQVTLAWMDRYGDIDGDGFYEYRTRSRQGIKNQGWKDSSQAILYPDGSLVRDPIAVAEVQGLYYAAKQAVALAFASLGERERAARLLDQAAALKKRFNARFWMPDLDFLARALDPEKRQVRTIASNAGICLASGIVDDDKTHAVVERLMRRDMFSGWGIRTLSSDHPAYNPLAYHLGTVWPVSTAHACVGFKRYGFDDQFYKLAEAVLEAAGLFEFDRLPEVFGGHERGRRQPYPGLYPGGCSPQAWSASAVIQICHMMTGIMTLAPLKTLVVDPALPEWLPEVALRNLRIGDDRASIILRHDESGDTTHEIVEGAEGWRVVSPPPSRPGVDRFALALAEAALRSPLRNARTRDSLRHSEDVSRRCRAVTSINLRSPTLFSKPILGAAGFSKTSPRRSRGARSRS